MAPTTPINSFSNYSNKLNIKPYAQTILDDYYSKIDQVWDYSYDIETIEIQSAIGSNEYYEKIVRAVNVFSPKTQDSRGVS